MKNKMTDLNNHLFAALERLNDEDLTPEQLEVEIKRSKAVSSIAKNIISSASVSLQAQKLIYNEGVPQKELPSVLKISNDK